VGGLEDAGGEKRGEDGLNHPPLDRYLFFFFLLELFFAFDFIFVFAFTFTFDFAFFFPAMFLLLKKVG